MAEEKTRRLMSERDMDDALHRIANEMIGDNIENVALVGIMTRGIPIAKWLAKKVQAIQNKPMDVGSLDISLYRDDLSEIGAKPIVKKGELPFSVTGKGIILVDDVLYTGRTIRAAMDALIDLGRPRFIKLMVMVDRGWRELPIQADYVGKSIKTTANENVKVKLAETDGTSEVMIRG